MQTIEKIIQISEDVEYPEGNNAVTVESQGDQPGIEFFRAVEVSLSASHIVSGGDTYVVVTADVWDPDEENSFGSREYIEGTDAGTPLSVSVSNYIDQSVLPEIYGWEGELNGVPILNPAKRIPLQYHDTPDGWEPKIEGSEIFIDENWIQTQTLYPRRPDVPGLFFTKVAVKYNGGLTVTFGTEGEEEEVHGELEQFSLSGEFSEDEVLAQKTVQTQWTPEAGSTGLGYITASFKNGLGKARLAVGNYKDANIALTMSADPSSVKVSQPSLIRAEVTYNSKPILEGKVFFKIYKGDGSLSSKSAELETEEGLEEETAPDNAGDPLSVSKHISAINWIKDPNGNNMSYGDIDGSEIEGDWTPKVPYTVNYDGGGIATTQFVASDIGDGEAIILGYYGEKQEFAELTIEEGTYYEQGLSITPDPASLTQDAEESTLKIVLTDEDGNADNGSSVKIYKTAGHGKISPGTVTTKKESVEDEDASVQDAGTVGVAQPVSEGSCHIEFNGQSFACSPGEGSTLKLNVPFPEHIFPVPCKAWYTSGGTAESTYTAPTPIRDETIVIMATASGNRKASCNIDCKEGDFAGTLECTSPDTVPSDSRFDVEVHLFTGTAPDPEVEGDEGEDYVPINGKEIELSVTNDGPGYFGDTHDQSISVKTGKEGRATASYRVPVGASGDIQFLAEYRGLTGESTTQIDDSAGGGYEKTFPVATLYLKANGVDGVYEKSDALWVKHGGAFDQSDQWGCADEDGSVLPLVLELKAFYFASDIPPSGYIKSVNISGAGLYDPDKYTGWEVPRVRNTLNPLRIFLEIPWPLGPVDRNIYVTVTDRVTGEAIQDASVTLSPTMSGVGPSATTDGTGKATFTAKDLTPGQYYYAFMQHANYVINQAGEEDSEGRVVQDLDPLNNRFYIPERLNSKPLQLGEINTMIQFGLTINKKWKV